MTITAKNAAGDRIELTGLSPDEVDDYLARFEAAGITDAEVTE